MKKLLLGLFFLGASGAFMDCSSGRQSQQLCSNTCEYANDGVCDDGGGGSTYSTCEYGTDCADCGPR